MTTTCLVVTNKNKNHKLDTRKDAKNWFSSCQPFRPQNWQGRQLVKYSKPKLILITLVLALGVCVMPLASWAAPPVSVNAAAPDLPDQARGVPMGGALRVHGLQIEQYGKTDLQLERISVFAPDATVTADGIGEMPAPKAAYFRGSLASDPDAMVFMAVPETGPARGAITNAAGAWKMHGKAKGLKTRKVDVEVELGTRTFECGVGNATFDGSQTLGLTLANQQAAAAAASGMPVVVGRTAHMIIDTDYEYWLQFWNAMSPGGASPSEVAAAALEYLGDLIAYASIPYERELNTNLVIQQARLWTINTDPYESNTNACGCDGEGKLDEVEDEWSGDGTARTLVHFISGKSEGCGCAYYGSSYTGVLCSQNSGYGASSSIGMGFDIDDPGFIWEGMVIAHEIGHNFGSRHTHRYCGIDGIDDPVDVCVESCLDPEPAGAPAVPGMGSLTGGTAGAGNGTIMSYCHQRSGSYANIAHTFGQYHPYGVAAYRVSDWMRGVSESGAGCMSLLYAGADLQIRKDCKPDDPMLVGDTGICTITMTNVGTDNALGISMVDDYLSDGTFEFGTVTLTKGDTSWTYDGPAGADDTAPCSYTTNPQAQSGSVSCDIDHIDVGHSAIVAIELTGDEPQNINDVVVVDSDSVDPNPANNMAEDELNIVATAADLRVLKDCKPDDPLLTGGEATCTILVDNLGPQTAEDVVLTDVHVADVPFTITGVTGTGCSGAGASDPNNSRTVTCDLGIMDVDERETIVVTVTADEPGNVNDIATVDALTADPDSSNNDASDRVTFRLTEVDLVVFKVCKPDSPYAIGSGDPTPYCDITVQNASEEAAAGVVLTDQILSLTNHEVTAVEEGGAYAPGACTATPPGDNTQTTITCDPIDLAPNGTATVHVEFTAPEPVEVNDTASATTTSNDVNPNNNSGNNPEAQDTVVFIEDADLSVTKECTPPTAQLPGLVASCTMTVTNHGPSLAANVTMQDRLLSTAPNPEFSLDDVRNSVNAGSFLLTCSPTGGPVNVSEFDIGCTLDADADMLPGDQFAVTVDVLANDPIVIADTATVASDTPDSVTGNNTAQGQVSYSGNANLMITKSDNPADVDAGTNLTYTIEVGNLGPSTAVNVEVTDFLPAQTEFVSTTGNCVAGVPGDPLQPTQCGLGNILSGDTVQFDITVKVLPDATGVIHNDVSVASDSYDGDNTNNQVTEDTTIVVNTDLVLTKIADRDTVTAGSELKYLLQLINYGPSTATDVILVDTLPPETHWVQTKVLGGVGDCLLSGADPDIVTCTLNDMDPDEEFLVVITVLVDPATIPGTITNNAVVTESSGPGDDAFEDTAVEAWADLWIDKTGSFLTDNPSSNILYTLIVRNDSGCSVNDPLICGEGGPSDAQNVVVVDTLPSTNKKLIVEYVSEYCIYDKPSHVVTCTTPTLAVGDTVIHEIEVDPRGSLRGIVNTAAVTSDTADPNEGNNTDDTLIIVGGGGQK